MALPKQVEAQLKELEAIEAQLSAAQNPAPQEPVAPAEPEKSEPAKDSVEQKPEAAPKPVEAEPSDDKWEQKYRTLKGMYDAEVPRLHAQVKELTSRMDQMARVQQEAPKPEVKPAAPTKLVTDDDVQTFGEDLIEVQRKVAREVAQEFRADLDALRAENEELRKQMATTGTKVSEASFDQQLHRLVPDFAQINVDPKWIEWLDEIDPMIRAPRKTIAQEAFARGDADGVAYYVDMFRKSVAPAEQPKNDRAAELERQIQPKRSASAPTKGSPSGRTFTTADVETMFQKVRQLGASGRLEEARKLEAEIDSAYMEGRVTA